MQRGGFCFYLSIGHLVLHAKFIGLDIHDFGGAALAIESDVVVRLRGEHEIGHGDAATINKDLDAALVDKDVEMISLAVAQAQRSPRAEGEVILVIDAVGGACRDLHLTVLMDVGLLLNLMDARLTSE